jgi:FKBP-type peptidyl-prolyl cis-trans isomerase 2
VVARSLLTRVLVCGTEDGTIAVDMTGGDDEPASFTLGDGTLLSGIELACKELKKGAKAVLTIQVPPLPPTTRALK